MSDPKTLRRRTFTASTVAECLSLARTELGADALILGKKTRRRGAILGRWGGRDVVEVTFGMDEPLPPAPSPGKRGGEERPAPSLMPFSLSPPPFPGEGAGGRGLHDLQAQLVALTGQMEMLAAENQTRQSVEIKAVGETYASLRRELRAADVSETLAARWIDDLPFGLGEQAAIATLTQRIARDVVLADLTPPPAPAPMQVWAFVGPTGAGKSATVAKLAARETKSGRRVGIVTLDTSRASAAAQTRAFGDILAVPVRVAYDRAELVKCLSEFAVLGIDLALIDTEGCSPNALSGDVPHVLRDTNAVQKFLVLPASLAPRAMQHAAARFADVFPCHALVFSKLDESESSACWGRLISLQAVHPLPLAFLTTGTSILDDLETPDAAEIASWLLS